MMIPSIDLMGGSTVQLVGGREKRLDAGPPAPIAERFSLAGPIAVIDLDAALGQGSNAHLIEPLCARFRCRVGGGIRSLDAATRWLDAGAEHVILGTAATADLLCRLPKHRVLAALDSVHDDIVTHGWTTRTGTSVLDRIAELKPFVDGFLVTFVETEGRMTGIDMDRARVIIEAAAPARVVIAGGVRSADEIAELDRMGADAQVGMALYTGAMDLADAITAPLRSDRPDGLFPTVVTDERGTALGLAYSNRESLRQAVKSRRGVYFSRSRNALWMKGDTSGATQELLAIDLDCDRDAVRFTVRQSEPGFCHQNTATCWGPHRGLSLLATTMLQRVTHAPPGSYTRRLLEDPSLLRAKLIEEAGELADASDPAQIAQEAADLMYFALARVAGAGVHLRDIELALDRRALRVTRRPGDAKPASEASS